MLWTPWNELGLEHLRLVQTADSVLADGLIIRMWGDRPLRLSYEIRCDAQYRVRATTIRSLGVTDGDGHWTDAAQQPLAILDGCIDIDIAATPFTNTLPIRRLQLTPAESSDLLMAYVTVPDLRLQPVRQRYTCLEVSANGGAYLYEGVSTGFRARLPVDADGLVLDYPEVFRRAWPR